MKSGSFWKFGMGGWTLGFSLAEEGLGVELLPAEAEAGERC